MFQCLCCWRRPGDRYRWIFGRSRNKKNHPRFHGGLWGLGSLKEISKSGQKNTRKAKVGTSFTFAPPNTSKLCEKSLGKAMAVFWNTSMTHRWFSTQKLPQISPLKPHFIPTPSANTIPSCASSRAQKPIATGRSCGTLGNQIEKAIPPGKDRWVFPKIGFFPPKWMVKIMENPIKMDDLGVPLFFETPRWLATPMSWFIMAPYQTSPPNLGVVIAIYGLTTV